MITIHYTLDTLYKKPTIQIYYILLNVKYLVIFLMQFLAIFIYLSVTLIQNNIN